MIRVGTIGTGFIVSTFLDAVSKAEGIQCVACYSRKEETGRKLADAFNVEKVYTDLEDFLNDEEINFIYVASPNSLHYKYSKAALAHHKNVICEKPFVVSVDHAKELKKIAKENHLFLFEAITTIYLPNYQKMCEQVKQLGQLTNVSANFSQYSSRYDKLLNGEAANVFTTEMAGGALEDLNVYNIHFVCRLLGMPESVQYYPTFWSNGVDTAGILMMKYDNFYASVLGAKNSYSKMMAQVQGEKGYITINSQVSMCTDYEVYDNRQNLLETVNVQEEENRLYYEVCAFVKEFEEQNYDQCYKDLDYTIDVVKVLEDARKSAGMELKDAED